MEELHRASSSPSPAYALTEFTARTLPRRRALPAPRGRELGELAGGDRHQSSAGGESEWKTFSGGGGSLKIDCGLERSDEDLAMDGHWRRR
uniref:Uncharacterized protein n=1 Tax=Oryza rufipogon TaxID=4529 RepID=A0A0E0Q851_ORYRU